MIKSDTLILYHGNRDKSMVPTFGTGRKNKDYGQGFYVTLDKELGKEWAWGSYNTGAKAYIHTYEIDIAGLRVCDFTELNNITCIAELEANRTQNTDDRDALEDRIELFIEKFKLDTSAFDIIVGYRADDSYFTYLTDFVWASIYRDQVNCIWNIGNDIELCIKSERAFERLRQIDIEEVPREYKGCYKKRRDEVRKIYRKALEDRGKSKSKKTVFDLLRV